ncbi:MAG: hypothetical protein ABI866_04210 [Dokdonella sp.]
MNAIFLLTTCIISAAIRAALTDVPVAYSGEIVITQDGSSQTLKIWSDGVRTRREATAANGDTVNWYYDDGKKLMWTYGTGY